MIFLCWIGLNILMFLVGGNLSFGVFVMRSFFNWCVFLVGNVIILCFRILCSVGCNDIFMCFVFVVVLDGRLECVRKFWVMFLDFKILL